MPRSFQISMLRVGVKPLCRVGKKFFVCKTVGRESFFGYEFFIFTRNVAVKVALNFEIEFSTISWRFESVINFAFFLISYSIFQSNQHQLKIKNFGGFKKVFWQCIQSKILVSPNIMAQKYVSCCKSWRSCAESLRFKNLSEHSPKLTVRHLGKVSPLSRRPRRRKKCRAEKKRLTRISAAARSSLRSGPGDGGTPR